MVYPGQGSVKGVHDLNTAAAGGLSLKGSGSNFRGVNLTDKTR